MKLPSHIRIWSVAWLLMVAVCAFGAQHQAEHHDRGAISGLEQAISSAESILERSGEPQVTVSVVAPHSFTRQSAFSPMLSSGDSSSSLHSLYSRHFCVITSRNMHIGSWPPRYIELRRLLI